MKNQSYDNQLLIEYLLGSLPDAETERLDELSFTDDDFVDALQSVENEMVDAYVRDELDPSVRARFESFYLSSPIRREKVSTARSLLKTAQLGAVAEAYDRRSWWKEVLALPRPVGFAAAAATILLLAGLSWLVVRDRASKAERAALDQRIVQLQAEVAKQQASFEEKQREIDDLRGKLAGVDQRAALEEPNVLPVVLEPQTRGIGSVRNVAIPRQSDFVTFQLELESGDEPNYQATLRSLPARQILWSRSGLRAQRRDSMNVLVITVRASLLSSQNYILELSDARQGAAADVITTYVFKAVKQ